MTEQSVTLITGTRKGIGRFLADHYLQQGHLVVAGPFSDQPDETLRGFCLYRTDLEETRRLAESDPSVQAGRMAVDVMGWWTKRGSLPF